MQPSLNTLARKEIAAFFASPVAFIFFGTFLLITLFIFFWVETFFARNITDVRPLFDWMPVLMIFLVAALTMRMWSEERRTGTLEFLLTHPVNPLRLVVGKFLACLFLVAISLMLTIPLPFSISLLGNLDWGPVFGAYLATLLLAAAYIAIGLAVSAKSDNQIISLIVTVLLISVIYLLGSDKLTALLGNEASEVFKLFGSGSRFESITRGVLDIRDSFYYLSIVGIFISLNVLFLESARWATGHDQLAHKRWRLVTLLLVANFFTGNIWLSQINQARIDLTEGEIYSISDATRSYLQQLQEPLLIRGYFSAKTHPLLAPLVPQIRDLLAEYQIAANGRVRTEFIDPMENPELEKEAGQKYGIKPVPFQVTSKYQASLVNSYFDVLIQYGDQHQVLSFRDLIEVKSQGDGDLDVQLRNPEYEITRSIKKVLNEYQSGGNLYANMSEDVSFLGYFSADKKLPPELANLKQEINTELLAVKSSSNGKFQFAFQDPDANGGKVAQEIADLYGFRPMQVSLFDENQFYFYMVLQSKALAIQVPLPEGLDKASFRRSLDAAIQRFSSGFLKNIALYTPAPPAPNPYMQQLGMPPQAGKQFRLLQEKLSENHKLNKTDLTNGMVAAAADLLLIAAPDQLDDKQVFAVDQFLMKGGTVVLATAPFQADLSSGNLSVAKHDSGLNDWLNHHGVSIDQQLVLDPQNAMLPIPVNRDLGGFTVQEIQLVEYPYFVDIRSDGMAAGGAMTAGLPQITMNWATPISITEQQGLKVTRLLQSTKAAWLSDSTHMVPDYNLNGELGFEAAQLRDQYLLAAAIEGSFTSFFKGKASPLLTDKPEAESPESPNETDLQSDESLRISSVIEKSPESARIIVFASNEFLTDQTIQLAATSGGVEYINSLQLVENAVDWSLEDRGLLSIRSRSHFSRTLFPLSNQEQAFWEYLNYALSLFGLLLVYLAYRIKRQNANRYYQEVLQLSGEQA